MINGADSFTDVGNINRNDRSDNVAVRFHLHPDINAKIVNNSIGVELTSAKGEHWTFTCVDARIEIEESIYLNPQATPTKQIVLSSPVLPPDEIRWGFQKSKNINKSVRQSSISTLSHTPQDLLDMMTYNSKSDEIK